MGERGVKKERKERPEIWCGAQERRKIGQRKMASAGPGGSGVPHASSHQQGGAELSHGGGHSASSSFNSSNAATPSSSSVAAPHAGVPRHNVGTSVSASNGTSGSSNGHAGGPPRQITEQDLARIVKVRPHSSFQGLPLRAPRRLIEYPSLASRRSR